MGNRSEEMCLNELGLKWLLRMIEDLDKPKQRGVLGSTKAMS